MTLMMSCCIGIDKISFYSIC